MIFFFSSGRVPSALTLEMKSKAVLFIAGPSGASRAVPAHPGAAPTMDNVLWLFFWFAFLLLCWFGVFFCLVLFVFWFFVCLLFGFFNKMPLPGLFGFSFSYLNVLI
uniref:Uncharacterized protein n=1 Tax=Malurus cyaneus samueli TaxID=2593467 RepID=A0A8C5U684_9PASS